MKIPVHEQLFFLIARRRRRKHTNAQIFLSSLVFPLFFSSVFLISFPPWFPHRTPPCPTSKKPLLHTNTTSSCLSSVLFLLSRSRHFLIIRYLHSVGREGKYDWSSKGGFPGRGRSIILELLLDFPEFCIEKLGGEGAGADGWMDECHWIREI